MVVVKHSCSSERDVHHNPKGRVEGKGACSQRRDVQRLGVQLDEMTFCCSAAAVAAGAAAAAAGVVATVAVVVVVIEVVVVAVAVVVEVPTAAITSADCSYVC